MDRWKKGLLCEGIEPTLGAVVNLTRDRIWAREGILPDYPSSQAPQQDFDSGQLLVPHPTTSREEIQEPFVREMEIRPEEYSPEGYHPGVLTQWLVEGDLVIPEEAMPPSLEQSMGEAWRQRKVYEEEMAQRAEVDDE